MPRTAESIRCPTTSPMHSMKSSLLEVGSCPMRMRESSRWTRERTEESAPTLRSLNPQVANRTPAVRSLQGSQAKVASERWVIQDHAHRWDGVLHPRHRSSRSRQLDSEDCVKAISDKRRPPTERRKRDCDPNGIMFFANCLREMLGFEKLYVDGQNREIIRATPRRRRSPKKEIA